MAIKGDFAKLERLVRALEDVGGDAFRRRLHTVLAEEAVTQVKAEFREERDPYGGAWARLRYRRGRILRDTGRLANSFAWHVTRDGFVVASNVEYAAVHQFGATLPPRTQVNAHDPRGRFLSRARAGRSTRTSVRVSFAAHAGATIPRRQMLPQQDTGGLGAIWSAAFADEADALVRRTMAGR